MASFTDSIPQFNPYVQQLPVEDMAKVGMHKQQKYEEGVQKIQSDIEKIAGLDIMRDVDKAYLQSKLNQLGSNLRPFMASDFSDFQLQNSVAGMTSAIGDDPNIQTAVNSTAFYRKQKELMEKAISEGKSAIQNQWDFGLGVNDWMSNPELGQGFNKRYTQYIDVKEKWLKVIKDLHSDLVEQDIPYERNSDGSINYDKTAAAMQRISKETVSAAKISNALKANLSPEEMNQLSIDGRYTFRDKDPQSLANLVRANYQVEMDKNNEALKNLEGLKTLSSSNPALLKKANDAIEQLKQQNKTIISKYEEEVKFVEKNPEEAKAMLYKNAAISQFAQANAWEHKKENVLTNPVKQQENWEKGYSLDVSKFRQSQVEFEWTQKMDLADLDIEKQKLDLKREEMYGKGSPITSYGGGNTSIEDPVQAMTNATTEYADAALKEYQQVLNSLPGVSTQQLDNAIALYQKGDPYWFKKNGANSEDIIPVNIRKGVNNIIKNRKLSDRYFSTIQKTTEEVNQMPIVKEAEKKVYQSVKGMPGFSVKIDNQSVSFTPEEIVNYKKKKKLVYQNMGGSGSSLTMGANSPNTVTEVTIVPLTEKEKLLERNDVRRSEPYKNLSLIIDKNLVEASKIRKKHMYDALLKKSGKWLPTQEAIILPSTEGSAARRTWEGIVNLAASSFGETMNNGQEGGDEKFSTTDRDEVIGWMSSDKGRDAIQYSRIIQGDKTYISVVKGGKEILVPIKSDIAAQLPITNSNIPDERYRDIVEAQQMGDGSTNPTGKFENSYWDKSNLPKVTLDVGIDLIKDNYSDEQYIKFILNTEAGPLELLTPYSQNIDSALKVINSLNNNFIKKAFIESNKFTPEQLEIIKNL